ncbi:MAG: thermonuclease family protein [Pelagibacteraceae bacterium]
MYMYNCKLVRVIDGDTVELDIDLGFAVTLRERVRLEGVNTPEIRGRAAESAGFEAKAFVEDWFASWKKFEYWSNKYNKHDKYGRSLGTIVAVDRFEVVSDLNSTLQMKGWKS